MQVEAIRQNGHYFIPYLDKVKPKSNRIMVEISNIDFPKEEVKKSESYKMLESLKKESGNNDLINLIMQDMPLDFEYIPSDLSDKEIAVEEKMRKYQRI